MPDKGKAERFIQTALREWLYGRPYATSAARATDMPAWLHWYNHHRPHAGIHAAYPCQQTEQPPWQQQLASFETRSQPAKRPATMFAASREPAARGMRWPNPTPC